MINRTVFFVSDGTGITAETFGNSILAQFAAKPRHVRRPFIDTVDKAWAVVHEINETSRREGQRSIGPLQQSFPAETRACVAMPEEAPVSHLHGAFPCRRPRLRPPWSCRLNI